MGSSSSETLAILFLIFFSFSPGNKLVAFFLMVKFAVVYMCSRKQLFFLPSAFHFFLPVCCVTSCYIRYLLPMYVPQAQEKFFCVRSRKKKTEQEDRKKPKFISSFYLELINCNFLRT